MTVLDRIIQKWRINTALRYVPRGGRLLDIGSADGELLRRHVGVDSIGIDPLLAQPGRYPFGSLVRGDFPRDLTDHGPFDVVTLLAVLEHVPAATQHTFIAAIAERLKPGGLVVCSVPSARVDVILSVLRSFRLIHGMSLEQHYGFDASTTIPLFEKAGFRLLVHRKFELGLNNIFVFTRLS